MGASFVKANCQGVDCYKSVVLERSVSKLNNGGDRTDVFILWVCACYWSFRYRLVARK